MNDLTKTSKSVKIWGWVVLIAGVFALLSPLVAGAFVTVMVGAMILIAGVTRVIDAFQGGGFWSGLFGAVYCIAGLMIIGDPLPGLLALTMVLVIYFLVVGITEIIAAFKIRPVDGWGYLLFSGIVSVLLSLMIWNQWPLSGAWAVGVLVGIQLMISGMTMITVGSALKNIAE
jgi:uncharacterized membrane protein HdeD (DUF308 family)